MPTLAFETGPNDRWDFFQKSPLESFHRFSKLKPPTLGFVPNRANTDSAQCQLGLNANCVKMPTWIFSTGAKDQLATYKLGLFLHVPIRVFGRNYQLGHFAKSSLMFRSWPLSKHLKAGD
jgi:hypothetical protein